MQLRDYQTECVERVVDAYERNPQGEEYLVLPCGAGKTIIFSAIIHTLARVHNLAALVLAHRDELLDQAIEKYQVVDATAVIGKVGGGVYNYGGDVTVAGIATVSRPNHIKTLRTLFGTGKGLIIVIDEFHHSQSDGYQRVIEAFPDAFLLGVTATPDRLDRKLLLDGKAPLFQMSIISMITRKYLCDMRVIAIRTETNLDDLHTRAGDFSQEELDLAINTPTRNKRVVEAYQEHADGKRAICFAVTVAHAQALAYAFKDAGVTAAVITGKTPTDERKLLYTQLRTGELRVLISVMVLSEGFDETSVECVIMARPTQSRALFVQCIGRGIRLHPGKEECLILDLTDNCLKHRLMPVNLCKTLDVDMHDEETVLQALARVEKEAIAEKEKQERKLKEKRLQDFHVNMFEILEWKKLPNGTFVMEVTRSKHKIALIPRKDDTDMYEVWVRWARRDGSYGHAQQWAKAQGLEYAQSWAEQKAKMLHEDGSKRKWLDKNENWRTQRIDPLSDQVKKMEYHNIAWDLNMTKGQASDLIEAHLAKIAREKALKAARKTEKIRV